MSLESTTNIDPVLRFFDEMLRDGMQYGHAHQKMVLLSPEMAQRIPDSTKHVPRGPISVLREGFSFLADLVLNGAYGFEIPALVIRKWSGCKAVVVDLDTFETWHMEVPA